jgi:hypothetical protein
MEKISNFGILQQRLRAKIEADQEQIERFRKETEKLMKTELQRLSESLRQSVNDTLNIIGPDIRLKAKRLRNYLLRPLLVGMVIGISLLATICGGSWATLHLISVRFQSEMKEKATLAQEISRQQQTLRQLQARTWGLTLYQDNTGTRWIILPDGVQAKMLTRGGKSAIELGR